MGAIPLQRDCSCLLRSASSDKLVSCFGELTLSEANGLSMTVLRLSVRPRSGNGHLAKPFVEIKGLKTRAFRAEEG